MLALGLVGLLAQYFMKRDRVEEYELSSVVSAQRSTYGLNKNMVLFELVTGQSFKVGTDQVDELLEVFSRARRG